MIVFCPKRETQRDTRTQRLKYRCQAHLSRPRGTRGRARSTVARRYRPGVRETQRDTRTQRLKYRCQAHGSVGERPFLIAIAPACWGYGKRKRPHTAAKTTRLPRIGGRATLSHCHRPGVLGIWQTETSAHNGKNNAAATDRWASDPFSLPSPRRAGDMANRNV